jgi:hypothetical protein
MRSVIFTFFVLIVLSAAFAAVGLLIAFWPATYLRWVRCSNVENYAPWVARGWDVYSWRCGIVGICMALFGVIAAILTVWIHWFQ